VLELFKYHFSLWGSTTSRRGDNNARRGQVGTAGGMAAAPCTLSRGPPLLEVQYNTGVYSPRYLLLGTALNAPCTLAVTKGSPWARFYDTTRAHGVHSSGRSRVRAVVIS
jgi:hypothetical protein